MTKRISLNASDFAYCIAFVRCVTCHFGCLLILSEPSRI
jgi:hypothetical protein